MATAERAALPLPNPRTVLVAAALIYIVVCCIRLDTIPANTDEAIYINRGVAGGALSHLRETKLLTLSLYALFLPKASHALWLARFLTAISAGVTVGLLGCFFLEDDRRYRALAPALLYALCPLAFFYGRIAMPEPFLVMTGTATLVASRRLAKHPGTGAAVLTGACIALGLTVQMIALLFLAFPLLAIACFGWAPWKRYIKSLAIGYAVPILALIPLCASGWGADVMAAGYIARQSPARHGWGTLLALAAPNGTKIFSWVLDSVTRPFLALAVLGGLAAVYRRNRADLFWLAVAVVYLLPFQLAAAILLPQYLIFAAVPLAALAAEGMETGGALLSRAWASVAVVPATWGFGIALILLTGFLVVRDYGIVFYPTTVPLTEVIRHAFVNTWASGYPSREVADFLKQRAALSPGGIRVVMFAVGDGVRGSLKVELLRSPGIQVQDSNLADAAERRQAMAPADGRPTYVVMDDPPFLADPHVDWQPIVTPLTPVFLAEKPEGRYSTAVYVPSSPTRIDGQAQALRGDSGRHNTPPDPRARITPEVRLNSAHQSVEFIDRGSEMPDLVTLAPIEVWFALLPEPKPRVFHFALRLPDDARAPVEAAVDLACESIRRSLFEQVIPVDGGSEWREASVALGVLSGSGCSVVLRALPARGTLMGGRTGRLLWSNLKVRDQ